MDPKASVLPTIPWRPNLTGNQLQAPAEVVAVHTGGDIRIVRGLDFSDDEDSENEAGEVHDAHATRMAAQPPPRKKRSMIKHSRDWKKEDIPTGLCTQQPCGHRNSYRSF